METPMLMLMQTLKSAEKLETKVSYPLWKKKSALFTP
jgi:hypothetical protein